MRENAIGVVIVNGKITDNTKKNYEKNITPYLTINAIAHDKGSIVFKYQLTLMI